MLDKINIVQFGTSRFLQAHADLFFSQANDQISVTVVQSSGDASRSNRLQSLCAPGGFEVRVRGQQDGKAIEYSEQVRSIKHALSTSTQWSAVSQAVIDSDYVLSNTSEKGFIPQPADNTASPDQAKSFPAKLCVFLFDRYRSGRLPPVLLPTELVAQNGSVLKARLIELASTWRLGSEFEAWLEPMPAANSLVDRIVSEPIEPAGAVAEPYALWAIEKDIGVTVPCEHPAIKLVEDLEPYERQKLHILNLGHTVLAELWSNNKGSATFTVRDAMAGVEGGTMRDVWQQEVLPGFESKGMGAQAQRYMGDTLERFQNPFLDHLVRDIVENHEEKVKRRIEAFCDWISDADNAPNTPMLSAIVDKYAR